MAASGEASWLCNLCGVSCSSPQVLAYHVIKGTQHKENLSRTAPQEVEKLRRLQYFLECYMVEEPVLGLEYVVEERLDSASYRYTCCMCRVQGDLCDTFVHLTKAQHIERYINKHHSLRSVKAEKYYTSADYLDALRARALEIQSHFGRGEIQVIEDAACGSTEETGPPPGNGVKEGASNGRVCYLCKVSCSSVVDLCTHVMAEPHKEKLKKIAPEAVKEVGRLQYFLDTHMKEVVVLGLEYITEEQPDSASYKYTCRLCQVEGDLMVIITHLGHMGHMQQVQKKQSAVECPPWVQKTAPLCPEDGAKKAGPLLHDGKGLNNCRTCDLCNVSCFLTKDLFKHFMGSKHKLKLSQTAPEEVKELGRLQYILDRHMKGEPALGLEHIVERELDSYACRLCNVEGDLLQMFNHISYVGHVERYVERHHNNLSLKMYSYPERVDYIKALTKVVVMIHEKYGRKVIQTNSDDIDSLAVAKEAIKNDDDEKKVTKPYLCSLCNISCPSVVQLCDHVLGKDHKRRLKRSTPEEVDEVGRLQYFLDTHLKEEPVLGLDQIVEEEQLDSSYRYTCQLCNVEAGLRQMLLHLGNVDHILCYVKRHHSQLIPDLNDCSKDTFLPTLNETICELYSQQGRKRVKLKCTITVGAGPSKVAKMAP